MIPERFALTSSCIPQALYYHILIKSVGCIKLTRYYFALPFKICLLKEEKEAYKVAQMCNAILKVFQIFIKIHIHFENKDL